MPRSPTVWTLNDVLGQQEVGLLFGLKMEQPCFEHKFSNLYLPRGFPIPHI